MKIFIPSYNRPETISTPWTLTEGWTKEVDFKVILHTEEQKALYIEADRIGEENIIVSGVPIEQGLGAQRAWIDEHLVKINEHYIQMDDNIQSFTKLDDPYYQQDFFQLENDRPRQSFLFETKISVDEFLKICNDMVLKMEELGTCLGGFAATENSFFRGQKWNDKSFIVGKTLILKRNTKTHFNSSYKTSDDYQITAENLLHYGCTLRNNFVYVKFPRYCAGGLGSLENRWEPYRIGALQLMRDYPGLFCINRGRKDMPVGSAIKIAKITKESLTNWRKAMGVTTCAI